MPAQSPFEILADEIGAVAGRIERECVLRLTAAIADLARKDAERELLLTKLMSDLSQRVEQRLATLRDGIDGTNGKDGRDGIDGKDGVDGANGRDGVDGAAGEPGVNGKDGRDGIDGKDGVDGANGRDGVDGAAGEPGVNGKDGRDGIDGKDGMNGADGKEGPAGRDGVDGKDGIDGKDGMPGAPGVDGKDGIDGKDGQIGQKGEPGERGLAGAPGKMPIIKSWIDRIHYEGDVVQHRGASFQATCDTAKEPGSSDEWACIAARGADGSGFVVRGTYTADKSYRSHDVVACNNGSFVALKDGPGACPGPDWQLLAGPGKRGEKGQSGDRGVQGERGNSGAALAGWDIQSDSYKALPVLSDGTRGPAIDLRGMFENYHSEAGPS